ncbi:MAG: DUF3500 domain-containing protein [Pirellulaceae bacterium]|nr:DUF3500 domain-containing protein [Pirellulaceae bacterium]
MLNETPLYCPECDEGFDLPEVRSRRSFLSAIGASAAVLAAGGVARGDEKPTTKLSTKPAEGLVKELFATLSEDQQKNLVMPFNHGGDATPTRLKTFNAPIGGKRIADNYTKAQQDLCRQILVSILSGEDAFKRLSRHGEWDSSESFEGCGMHLFGEPDSKFAMVFAGHHITLRCDGDSEPKAAFGGPIYYGHSEPGYSTANVYNYQTRAVQEVFDALNEEQRKTAMATKPAGDGQGALRPLKPRHGIAFKDLEGDQKELVEKVMRSLLGPFRHEDVEEVMQIVKAGGGMDEINLAFYKDKEVDGKVQWSFWRLEGPGFVWNYRPLPHVHCFVSVQNA